MEAGRASLLVIGRLAVAGDGDQTHAGEAGDVAEMRRELETVHDRQSEVEEGDVPGVVVSRVNLSPRFMRELLDAMNDSWSKWETREGIRNLPESGR